jgi:integrase
MDLKLSSAEPAAESLVFAGTNDRPFQAAVIYRRADRAWAKAGLGHLRLHQARHAYASFMIAEGVNAKALSAFVGHSSIKVTFDLYGHLMPGTEAEAASLLDDFLGAQIAEASREVRGSQLDAARPGS